MKQYVSGRVFNREGQQLTDVVFEFCIKTHSFWPWARRSDWLLKWVHPDETGRCSFLVKT